MFSNFQQRFPLQDLRQWVPLLDMFPLDSEAVSVGPPDAETLLDTFLPGSIYGLYQKGDTFPRPFWPVTKAFRALPIPSVFPIEPKIDLVSSLKHELPVPVLRVTIADDIPARVQTPTPEIPTIRNKISTPCFTRPSTPTRPGTPTNRPNTPVDVRSSLPHPQKQSLSNTLSGAFSTVKKSPSVRDFLGTAANFASEAKSTSILQQKVQDVPLPTVSVSLEGPTSSNGIDCPYTVREKQNQEKQKYMALVQYQSPVIQLSLSGPIQNGSPPRKELSYVIAERAQESAPGLILYDKPSKETVEIPIDPRYRVLVPQYLKRLQRKTAKVQFQFSPTTPGINVSTGQQSSLVRFNRTFNNHRSLESQSSFAPELYVESRYRSYVHHFLRKSAWKTAAAGSSRSIKEVMQELRKDSIFLNTIAPGAILQALDDAVVARLRQSLSAQDGNHSITRFGDASARMDDLRRFLESLTMDNGECVEFEHWIEELPEDYEQTLRIDFTNGTPAIRGTSLGPKEVRDAVRRRMMTFRPQASRESEFAFDTPAAVNGIPLKRALGNKSSAGSLRLYKRTRNRSSDDVSLQRPGNLTIITTSTEKLRAIGNSSIRELILSPINNSSTQIDDQISDTLFVESMADSRPSTPASTAGSAERWERSSTLSSFSMGSLGSLGSAQTGLTVPHPGPALSFTSGRAAKKYAPEEEEEEEEEEEVSAVQPLCTVQISESQNENEVHSFPVPAYNRFLTPKKCRSISEITFDNPKEYRAERLKRGFSSTSSLTKLSVSSCLPTLLSPIESQTESDKERTARDSMEVATQIKELEGPFVFGPSPILPAEPRRADSGYSGSEGHRSAQGLLKEIAAVGEDVKRVTQIGHKTTTKEVKITASREEEEAREVEEKAGKKNKLFGRLKDRVKGLKKKVSGAMKGGKEN